MSTEVRFASFNAFLNRSNEGELIENLSTPDDIQVQAVAEIIQRTNPDVLLLNEFDFDQNGEAIQLFQENYLSVSQNGVDPVEYPYVYLAPSNTGIPSGFDFDNDGTTDGPGDAFGFGFFPGQFGMVLLSKYPIVEDEVRTFQEFLWKDMPDAMLPDNPETPEPQDYYSPEELEVFRLSSKNHWDVPIEVNGEIIHVLASHPTPPVFDGEEDRNGTRNFDEIRFWADYITPGNGEYIYDDNGNVGGLTSGERFVIMGDQNADPYDGDSTPGAIQQLLNNSFVNISATPASVGGEDAAIRQGGANLNHLGDPSLDTADFNDAGAGNLRVDYVLPSANLEITDTAVFWPDSDDPLFDLVGEGFPVVSSDHRLVYADVAIPEVPSNIRQTVTDVEFLGEVVFETGFEFENTEVGGISGITYNPFQDTYYALSDDRGTRSSPIPEAGSLTEYIGYRNGRYFIEVPDDEINDFFAWDENYPDLMSAHRGGFTAGFPENAIETFENTLTVTPALLEVDVRRTADGEWVLIHDETLDRTTTGTGLVAETTLAEIQTLQLVDNDGNVTDFQVPTLQDALEWAEGRTILELDLKSDEFFAEIVEIITELDAEDQVRFITQNIEQAIAIYNLNPEIHLGVFITADNQAEIFDNIEAAPFDFENVSAFTGTRPQSQDFYETLHNEGIVAIQGLFGNQDFFGESTFINDLTEEQRTELFETVYRRGGDVIASDFFQPLSELLDYSQSPLSRYYTVDIDLSDSHLNDGDVVFTDVTSLLDADGNPFLPGELDPEGIALTTFGTVFISSEGDVSPNRGEDGIINPFVNEFSLTGQEIRELPVPEKFFPEIEDTNNNGIVDQGDTPISGIQRNRAFENLTITPDQRTLYTATEGALTQDLVTEDGVNPSRIIQYDLTTGEPVEELLYFPDEFESTFGLVELVALDNTGTLLSIERTFSPEAGNTLRLFEVNTEFATNIAPETALTDLETLNTIAPVEKRLLLDFDELDIRLDNSEAVAFGPTLEDGRQSLIVVSDNNFNTGNQITQFLGFALDIEPAPQPKLVGFASLPADTFAEGPDSGEGVSSAERTGPFPGQPVGGWSGVQFADQDSYWFLVDSLFGGDSDTLARIYKVDPNFAGLENGDGTVELQEEFITLSDPNNFVPFEIRNADDPERPLTGTDFDTEALVVGANGDLWVGDEYGPYLLHFDPNGVLLKAPIPTPEITIDGAVEGEFVRSPQNPEVESGEAEANLRGSRGFEGIAYSPDRSILYPILEAPVEGDPENSLRIYQYDVAAGEYASELVGLYPLDNPGDTPTFQLGDFTPINENEFLVIERDDFEAEDAFFKKVFKVDISDVDENGFVKKEEIIDLLDIADPDDLNGDNSLAFDLPITSVEDVLVYDENTVLVSVDNNYPFGDFATGRPPELDNNEIILVELPEPLDLDPLLGVNGFIPEANTLPNGVASGDTTQNSTVLWTRSLAEGEVTFEYSTDADFNSIVGIVTATVEETNIPVKVEVTELEAGTDYYYRVTDAAGTTAEGIFETAAELNTQAGLSFGVTGDWQGELAPYPAITNVAEQELDFFVEHGDTIYADIASPAVLNPDGTRKQQVETLDEYRAKHNEVYSERFGLNAWADVRSSTSILATIDDHEVINDFAGGAPASSDERFPETEGLINDTELFENGLQTFQEYNPLRDDFYGETGEERTEGERQLYRYNTYGSDAAVMVLDTRSFRDEAIAGPEDFTNPEQVAQVLTQTLTEDITMLGEVQLADLKQDLVAADDAGITWKFVMVPEPMQNIFPGVNTDAFEGYGKERTEILKFITENEIDNVVFVAADVHTTFVNNLTYQEEPFGEQIPTNIFGITTGAVAFDAPTGEFLGNLFVSGNPEAEALYNSLPIAPDTDDIPDDKDDFVEQAINSTLLEPLGFDPLGLDNNLPQAEGLIDAELLQGDYFVGHTYGWTQFDIDSETQELTVTTYGIEAYTEEELLANPEEIISQEPEIVSQFVVNPQADTPTPPEPRKTISNIEFIGEGNLETGLIFEGTEVGGLSGIAYDEANNTYYAISDDRSNINPARFYKLSIDLSDGTLDTNDITVEGVTTLLDTEGELFNEESLDPEGIALTEAGTVIISSEGNVGELVNPFVNEFSLDGQQLQEFPIPEKFLPTADQSQGIRDNEAFESLTLTPDGNTLYTAAESALFQDGPSAGINQESLARIIKYNVATGEPQQEFVYQVDAIEPPETPDDISRTNSLAELLAVDNAGTFLALERFFDSTGVNDNKLYEVSLADATDVSEFDSIAGEDFTAITEKKLLVDFSEIGMNLDDFEGLVFGPELPDGRQSLIVVSDNDFDPATPATQFFAFAVELEAVSDTPVGTDGDDILTGTNTSETIAGGLGNDNIEGNAGDDVLRGDADSRSTGGSVGGNDTINGGSGDDQIGGKAGNDELFGDEGNDAIWGDDGDDILRGGLGNDTLTGDNFSGGQGSDTFVFAMGEGTDTLVDFEVGVDFIGLAEGLTPEQLAIAQVNQNTEISVDNETLAILSQVNAETLITNNPFVTL